MIILIRFGFGSRAPCPADAGLPPKGGLISMYKLNYLE